MIARALLGVLIIVGLASLSVLALRRGFVSRLDRLEASTREADTPRNARSDLPPAVLALAQRTGARTRGASTSAVFEQTGQMWRTPGGHPMDFTARQTVNINTAQFVWRATMGPGGIVVVADYLVGGTGGLEVRAFGAIPLARAVGGVGMNRGEALRYLAELPWNPDAILSNRSLDWTVVGPRELRVATGVGPARGEVTFELDGSGLIVRAKAATERFIPFER